MAAQHFHTFILVLTNKNSTQYCKAGGRITEGDDCFDTRCISDESISRKRDEKWYQDLWEHQSIIIHPNIWLLFSFKQETQRQDVPDQRGPGLNLWLHHRLPVPRAEKFMTRFSLWKEWATSAYNEKKKYYSLCLNMKHWHWMGLKGDRGKLRCYKVDICTKRPLWRGRQGSRPSAHCRCLPQGNLPLKQGELI